MTKAHKYFGGSGASKLDAFERACLNKIGYLERAELRMQKSIQTFCNRAPETVWNLCGN